MPIQNLHRTIILYYTSPFFADIPSTPDQIKRVITDMFSAVQLQKKNDFYPLAKLFNKPENFFNLQLCGRLTRGEARECIIDIIDTHLQHAAAKASVTTEELGWKKETLLADIKERNDHNDDLICQDNDPPDEMNFFAFIRSLSEEKVEAKEELREASASLDEKEIAQSSSTNQLTLFSDSMNNAKINSFIKSVNLDPPFSKSTTKVLFDHLSLTELKRIYLTKIPIEPSQNEFKIDPALLSQLKQRIEERIDHMEEVNRQNQNQSPSLP